MIYEKREAPWERKGSQGTKGDYTACSRLSREKVASMEGAGRHALIVAKDML